MKNRPTKLVDHAAKIGAQNKLDDASLQESAPNMISSSTNPFYRKEYRYW